MQRKDRRSRHTRQSNFVRALVPRPGSIDELRTLRTLVFQPSGNGSTTQYSLDRALARRTNWRAPGKIVRAGGRQPSFARRKVKLQRPGKLGRISENRTRLYTPKGLTNRTITRDG